MARPKRTAAAAAQTKVAEVKAEVKETVKAPETAVKAETDVKAETAAKAAAPAKAEAAPKKETASKAVVEKTVVVEFAGKQVKAKDVLAQAEKAYAESHPGVEIKSVELYISPEQNAAFYVVNGEASEEYRIEL